MILATLALARGRKVSQLRLQECLWDAPPASADTNLRTHLTRLRHALGPARDRLLRTGDSYALHLGPTELDIFDFESALAESGEHERAGRPSSAAKALETALGVWRGTAGEGLARYGTTSLQLEGLDADRADAVERYASLCLSVGRADAVITAITPLVEENPAREEAWALLVMAHVEMGDLYRARRAVTHAVETLERELGQSSTRLRDLLRFIERKAETSRTKDRTAVPTSLVGRGEVFSRILETLTYSPTVLLWGPAGVGKSALAEGVLEHLVQDGQSRFVYLDFCGYASGLTPMTCDEAAMAVLQGLGLTSPPGSGAAALTMLRQRVSTAVVVVLDNVDDASKVRPLLSALSGAKVIVTSRSPMPSLGCVSVPIAPLELADAVEFLAAEFGDRFQHPGDLDSLAKLCGRLPLALKIIAARAATHPDWTVCQMVERLRDERLRLDELSCDDLDVRAGLQVAARHLATQDGGQTSLRLLGRWGAARMHSMSTELAAALLNTTCRDAAAALDRLVETGLAVASDQAWWLHDLVRLFAMEQAPGDTGAVTISRQYLLDTCRRSREVLRVDIYRRSDMFDLGNPIVTIQGVDEALAWWERERLNLLAAIRFARDEQGGEADLFAARLPAGVYPFLPMRGYYRDLLEISEAALVASGRLKDVSDEAFALTYSAIARARLGEPDCAIAMLERALTLRRSFGDQRLVAVALDHLGTELALAGRAEEAVTVFGEALGMHRREGPSVALGTCLNNLADVLLTLKQPQQALSLLQECQLIRASFGDRLGAAITKLTMGQVLAMVGRHGDASLTLDEALMAARELGNREAEWRALVSRAEISRTTGRCTEARRDLLQALEISTAVADESRIAVVHEALSGLR